MYKDRKRDDLNIQVHNTIFSKYLALPIATFPLLQTLTHKIRNKIVTP
jgi:hypothetical protein